MTYDWKNMLPARRLERGEWWERAWTLTAGCSKVSQGCKNCWAASMSHARRNHPNEAVRRQYGHTTAHGDWDGTVQVLRQNLDVPLRRKKPTVFTVWNDLFHEDVPAAFIESAWTVMARCPRHLFVILTKRPERAARLIPASWRLQIILDNLDVSEPAPQLPGWPLPNVVIGTSIEDQATADARLPALLQCEAVARIVSAEPLLGMVDLTRILFTYGGYENLLCTDVSDWAKRCGIDHTYGIDGVIVGGESGKDARPVDPAWVSFIRDQCEHYGVPFFVKQWGEWAPRWLDEDDWPESPPPDKWHVWSASGGPAGYEPRVFRCSERIGKRRAGRLLDGRTWDELPVVGENP